VIPAYTHDTYLSNVLPTGITQLVRSALEEVSRDRSRHGLNFPCASSFQTITDLRDSLRATSICSYFVVSTSTRFRIAGNQIEYLFQGGWSRAAESEAAEFFVRTNLALCEADPARRPSGEYWYAMVCGHFPQALVESLRKCRRSFHAVKVGSSRPIRLGDVRYDPLWRWCCDEDLPVLLHCSGESESDFVDGLQICRNYPSLSVTLSHLGGIRQRGDDCETQNKRTLLDRAHLLKQTGLPENLTLNNAVYDIELTDYLLDAAPELECRILNALDLPFFGAIEQSINRLSRCRASSEIMENTVRYFSKFC
jgi:hypothetical protein